MAFFEFTHALGGIASTTEPMMPEFAIAYRVNDWLIETFRRFDLEFTTAHSLGELGRKNYRLLRARCSNSRKETQRLIAALSHLLLFQDCSRIFVF